MSEKAGSCNNTLYDKVVLGDASRVSPEVRRMPGRLDAETPPSVAATGGMALAADADAKEPLRPAKQSQAYLDRVNVAKTHSKTAFGRAVGNMYQGIERSASQVRRDGDLGIRTVGQFTRALVRTPRYVKSVGDTVVGTYRNIRYASKLVKDVKNGALSGKEAGLAALTRGAGSIAGVGKAAISHMGGEAADFHGSDDLGVEAVRRPKDLVVNTYRTLRVTSRAASTAAKIPKKAKRVVKGTARAAKQAVEYASAAARTGLKALSSPVVLKSMLTGGLVVLCTVLLMAVVSGISSVFSSLTLSSSDAELTKTYSYMTELDTDLNLQVAKIEEQSQYLDIEQFHYRLNGVLVSRAEMRIMTNTDYFLNYLDIRFKEYTLGGMISFLGGTVRDEITAIHGMLYTLTKNNWTEKKDHVIVVTDPLGIEHKVPWTETIDHLDVSLVTIPIEAYIGSNKTALLGAGQEQQYSALNEVGGMNLRQELGNPFPGYDWKSNLSVTTRFGWRVHPIEQLKKFHDGIDIGRTEGTPIQAVMGGMVTSVIFSDLGYGNHIEIESGNRTNLYAHCKDIHVAVGQTVRRGDIIGTVGNTGASTDPHLHLEFVKDGVRMNPAFFVATK